MTVDGALESEVIVVVYNPLGSIKRYNASEVTHGMGAGPIRGPLDGVGMSEGSANQFVASDSFH